jgi:hypothetical protein
MIIKLIALVLPLGLDTLVVAAALGVAELDARALKRGIGSQPLDKSVTSCASRRCNCCG